MSCACAKKKTHAWILSSLFNEPKEQSVSHSPISSSCLDLSPARLMGGGRGTEEGTGDRSGHMAKFILETRKKNTGNNNSLQPLHLWPREACLPSFRLCTACSTQINSLEAEPVMILAHHRVLMVPQNPTGASRQHCRLYRTQMRCLMYSVCTRQTWHSPACDIRRPAEEWDGFQALLTTSSITFPRNNSLTRNKILPLILLSRKLGSWINNTNPYIPNLLVRVICSMEARQQ